MKNKILKARGANGPAAEGYALVCPNSIQGWSALEMDTGVIIEKGHLYEGESVKGKILVVPCSRGSLGWSDYFFACHLHGVGPMGYVFKKMDSKCATTVALADVPCVADFGPDCDPCEEIKTGDYIRIDGDIGTVEILKSVE